MWSLRLILNFLLYLISTTSLKNTPINIRNNTFRRLSKVHHISYNLSFPDDTVNELDGLLETISGWLSEYENTGNSTSSHIPEPVLDTESHTPSHIPGNDLAVNNTINNRPPVIIIIHGGAWRSGDKSELESFCEKLTKISNYVVVNVNYQLTIANISPNIKHPIHIEDVAKAIYWVYQNSDKFGYNHDRIYLIGQSCGAFIATHLALLSEKYFGNIFNQHQEERKEGKGEELNKLIKSIVGVVCIEGIFDIPLLLKTWPKYIEFIRLPFGEYELIHQSASPQHILSTNNDNDNNKSLPPHLIIHSLEDELVDLSQSKNYYKILKDKKTIVKLETSLKGTHMGIMYTNQLVDKIWEFIISIESN
ncbi:8949_t:CDS:2 [Entrophospora sp. SA101]|nr:4015_t:CDS:2 [Entrophospora sp. SA101]CAJ0760428.1 11255_t:CDS:2 [Entrophospora sp. SA101]CAJ0768275.1 8949_t:CDS:2 [Entrophospora sp. SA101]